MNEDNFDNIKHDDDDDDYIISRSQKKRDVEALQTLGERLVDLKPAQLDKLPLEETLRDAVDKAKGMPHRSALRRQMQYIGKLMRFADGEAIAEAIERFDVTKEAHNKVFHKLEKWRDRLIANTTDSTMLDVIISEYPHTDIQHMRQLVRNAQKEVEQNKPPAAARKLFKYLRELEENQ
jgi:ribosome-associated protein